MDGLAWLGEGDFSLLHRIWTWELTFIERHHRVGPQEAPITGADFGVNPAFFFS